MPVFSHFDFKIFPAFVYTWFAQKIIFDFNGLFYRVLLDGTLAISERRIVR